LKKKKKGEPKVIPKEESNSTSLAQKELDKYKQYVYDCLKKG
jgi:hypothetical protein